MNKNYLMIIAVLVIAMIVIILSPDEQGQIAALVMGGVGVGISGIILRISWGKTILGVTIYSLIVTSLNLLFS